MEISHINYILSHTGNAADAAEWTRNGYRSGRRDKRMEQDIIEKHLRRRAIVFSKVGKHISLCIILNIILRVFDGAVRIQLHRRGEGTRTRG